MALTPYALTSLEMARSHLNISATDTTQTPRLELFVNAATARIESMTDRLLKERTITELRSGRKNNIIVLRQWPVTAITSVKVDSESVFSAESALSPSDYQIADDQTAVQIKGRVFESGTNNIQIVYTAGYNATDHAGQLADLEIATLWMVEWFYRHRERGDMGRSSKSKGDESVGILIDMPPMIQAIIRDYKRLEAPLSDRPIENL